MAWTAPRTWIVGEIVTATMLNTHLRDNLLQLRSDLNRESSFVVAASDAPQVMKDYADYLCDGNQDQTEISAAIAACGVIGGKVVLSSGTFLVDNSITFANSYVTLQGQGESTIIKVKNAANTVFKILDISSKTGLNLCDFKIDGNRANNTNGGSGIYFNGTTKCRLSNLTIINTYASSVYIDTGSNENDFCDVYIYNSADRGILLFSNAIRNKFVNITVEAAQTAGFDVLAGCSENFFSHCVANQCVMNGFAITSCNWNRFIGCEAITNNGNAGFFVGGGQENEFLDCLSSGNINAGFRLDNGTLLNTIANCVSRNNGTRGMLIGSDSTHTADQNIISGNQVNGNTTKGIEVRNSTWNHIVGNKVYNNGHDGILSVDSKYGAVNANFVNNNSQAASNTYAGIALDGDSDRNSVIDNTVKCVIGAIPQNYGIRIVAATCDDNLVSGNDLIDSGLTGTLLDGGTATKGLPVGTTPANANRLV